MDPPGDGGAGAPRISARRTPLDTSMAQFVIHNRRSGIGPRRQGRAQVVHRTYPPSRASTARRRFPLPQQRHHPYHRGLVVRGRPRRFFARGSARVDGGRVGRMAAGTMRLQAGRLELESILRAPLVVIADPVVAASGPPATLDERARRGSGAAGAARRHDAGLRQPGPRLRPVRLGRPPRRWPWWPTPTPTRCSTRRGS